MMASVTTTFAAERAADSPAPTTRTSRPVTTGLDPEHAMIALRQEFPAP